MGKNQHVVPYEDKWAVRGEGNERVTSIYQTQKEANEGAREISINNRTEIVIHGVDGKIRDKDSYGSDRCPPKDRKH